MSKSADIALWPPHAGIHVCTYFHTHEYAYRHMPKNQKQVMVESDLGSLATPQFADPRRNKTSKINVTDTTCDDCHERNTECRGGQVWGANLLWRDPES